MHGHRNLKLCHLICAGTVPLVWQGELLMVWNFSSVVWFHVRESILWSAAMRDSLFWPAGFWKVLSREGGGCLKNVGDHSVEYLVWAMTECSFEPVGLRPSCIQGAHTHFPLFSPSGSIPHPLVLIHLRRSSCTTVSFHLNGPFSLSECFTHSTTWQVKFPLSFLLLTLLKCYYGASVAYSLVVCSNKTGYLVCHLKYAYTGWRRIH